MGNQVGKGANRMAIAAMANVVQFDKAELLAMQKKFNELAQRSGNPATINREEFQEALEIVGVAESDKEILDRGWSSSGSDPKDGSPDLESRSNDAPNERQQL